MEPKKGRYEVRNGDFFIDGQIQDMDSRVLSIILMGDGYADIENAIVTEETVQRILRVKSAVSLTQMMVDLSVEEELLDTFGDEELEGSRETDSPPAPRHHPEPSSFVGRKKRKPDGTDSMNPRL